MLVRMAKWCLVIRGVKGRLEEDFDLYARLPRLIEDFIYNISIVGLPINHPEGFNDFVITSQIVYVKKNKNREYGDDNNQLKEYYVIGTGSENPYEYKVCLDDVISFDEIVKRIIGSGD